MNKLELVYTAQNQLYHLHIDQSHVADRVIIVGDPSRVGLFTQHFSEITAEGSNRNYVAVRGLYKGQDISVMSHGIGVGNIDIFVHELDAAINVNASTKEVNEELRKLNIVRYGTSGSIHPDFNIGDLVLSKYSIGLDGLPGFYNFRKDKLFETDLSKAFIRTAGWNTALALPYAVEASQSLCEAFSDIASEAITLCSPGFYGPQSRLTRLPFTIDLLSPSLSAMRYKELAVGNIEMESAPLYALALALQHEVITVSTILANRRTGEFAKEPEKLIEGHVLAILDKLTMR